MCCIIYKPKGTEMPSYETLKDIARINRDGFGFVSTRHHFKSLDFDSFINHLSKVEDDEQCIIHMRFATQGSVCKNNTHPFVSDGVYFAHNGVLPYYPSNNITDSEYVFRTKLMPIIERYGFSSDELSIAVGRVIGGSKFALMYKNKVRLFGEYHLYEGCYYSNMRWCKIGTPYKLCAIN